LKQQNEGTVKVFQRKAQPEKKLKYGLISLVQILE
jgi:hypothetical protein